MGDISAEPSMEEILSSIKRIIAEEGDGAMAAARARRTPRPAPAPLPEPQPYDDEEILELSDPVAAEAAPQPAPTPESRPASEPVAAVAPMAAAPAASAPASSLLSPRTAEATRGPLDALSRMVVKPEVAGSDTLEGMVREMIRPMLRDWLDANLPQLVESMVAREISRITGQPR